MGYRTDADTKKEVTILFEPDVLLPAQYFETTKKKFQAMPEKDLALAVLEDAVYSFQKYLLVPDKKRKLLFKEAERWIFDDDDSRVFSYRNVCDVLGIDADYLRLGLLRWKKKRLAVQVYKVKRKHRLHGV
jgi:hypothetical protein